MVDDLRTIFAPVSYEPSGTHKKKRDRETCNERQHLIQLDSTAYKDRGPYRSRAKAFHSDTGDMVKKLIGKALSLRKHQPKWNVIHPTVSMFWEEQQATSLHTWIRLSVSIVGSEDNKVPSKMLEKSRFIGNIWRQREAMLIEQCSGPSFWKDPTSWLLRLEWQRAVDSSSF